jgi:hypothetical protein|tara:strand:+ start:49 stop:444 length:396 start_codon:yes stop_codon:yes gene_type:complete
MNGTNPKKHYITAKYDFAVDATGAGGFPRTITLATTSTLPDNAIVNEVVMYCPTAVTSAGAATLGINAGGVNVTDLVAKAVLTDEVVVSTEKVKAGGKATSAAPIKVINGTAAFTAGVVEITVGYFIGTKE